MTSVAIALAVLGLTGCDIDEILSINDRDVVQEETAGDPDLLEFVVAGAKGAFADVFSGGDSYVTISGVMSDEFFSSGTFTTRTATDRREQFPIEGGNTSDGVYTGLHFARRALKDAAASVAEIEGSDDNEDYIEVKALEGYTVLHLGEAFCSAVPLSSYDFEADEQNLGTPLTSAMLFDTAIAKFDAALGAGTSHMASIGKARALLDLGRYTEAAAAVAAVPTDYTYFIAHSQSGVQNGIYSLQANGRYSQSDNEGGNGLQFRTPEDPRAPWVEDPEGGFDSSIPLYLSQRYNDYDQGVPFATGVEARLIEAEAALQADDFAGMTAILNALRDDVAIIMGEWVDGYETIVPGASLGDLATPGSRTAAEDQLFAERAFWLYLTGHRLGDLRRLVYQYGRNQADVYPTGAYHKGGTYGDDVVFPIDFDETNNENFTTDMCDVDDAGIN